MTLVATLSGVCHDHSRQRHRQRIRALATVTRTCGIEFTPAAGAWNDLNATDVRPVFADLTGIECGNRNRLKMTITPASSVSNPVIRFTDATPWAKYKLLVDGAPGGGLVTGCPNSQCTAGGDGVVTFSWNGSLSSSKTISLTARRVPGWQGIYN